MSLFQGHHYYRVMMVVEVVLPDERTPESLRFRTVLSDIYRYEKAFWGISRHA